MEIECTQKLECTQDQNDTWFERTNPEQVGYLGICGKKYPVSKGPNKIGRDPKSCSIVLNLNSISRHHAVINVLNTKEFMLMDLDSINKTKVQGNTLQPYIPHPLKNFDMVQFGDVFGIFRLLEESDDLPMTQAVDIPCTPVPVSKQISRCGAPSVLIPESPEVSDKDDSFIMPSQPIQTFKSPSNKFIKPSKKAVAIQPMGSKKIDNAYWQSGKKSESFSLDDSSSSLNDSTESLKSNKVIDESNDSIHEMETQEPYKINESTDSIYTAETQPPPSPSIHFMETQHPVSDIHGLETQQPDDIHNLNTQNVVEPIHDCATQAPVGNLSPELPKINSHDEPDLRIDNKEIDSSIYNAETQMFFTKEEDVEPKKEDNLVEPIKDDPMVESKNDDDPIEPNKPADPNRNILENSKVKNDSDEEILFDEINTQSIDESFESQQLLHAEVSPQIDKIEPIRVSSTSVQLASSTSCVSSEILPTQKITFDFDMLPTQKIINDIDMLPTQKINNVDEDLTDCEDDFVNDEFTKPKSPEISFEDMATQILGDDEIAAELPQSKDRIDGASKEINIEDMPTQVISDDSKDENFEDMPTQVIIEENSNDSGIVPIKDEVDSPFKVPNSTPMKHKKNSSLALKTTPKLKENVKEDVDGPNYYAATQDILNDLCSQKDQVPNDTKQGTTNNEPDNDDDFVPCSVEECQADDRFPHLENDLTPVNLSPSNEENQAKNQKTTANSKQKGSIEKLHVNTDNRTPKPLKIINTDLPDSQEIKTSVTLHHDSITDSSSDTEGEDISDQDIKMTFGKKKKNSKINAKIDLTKKFEESLPSRIITRVRKPTYKVQNSDESTKRQCKSILKSSILDDNGENIDSEIINENISRLKSKREKRREKGDNTKSHTDEPKKRSSSRHESKKSEESKEESNNASKSRSSRSKTKKSTETKSNHKSHDDSDNEKEVRSTRSSRSKKEDSKSDKSRRERDKKSESKDEEHSDSKSKSRTRHGKKEETKTRDVSKSKDSDKRRPNKPESSPEMEIRRSKRQKLLEKKETDNEMSTVYCLSSDSSIESPKTLKRRGCNELEVPSPKRTRSLPNSKNSSVCMSSDVASSSTPVRSEIHYVLFTAFSNDDIRVKLEKLGAVLVTDVMECTVLVTLQIKRTFKLLCAIGLGRPIVGPAWVQACADTNTIVDPWQYLVKDEPAELRFRFSLQKTLRGKRGFLRGYNVTSTPSVLPNAQEMKLIVECSGGSWGEGGPKWVVVSSSADRALWPALRRRGANIVSTEFILGGVLRQEVDLASVSFGPVEPKKAAAPGEWVCGVCGRRCMSRAGLSSHVRSHTKN